MRRHLLSAFLVTFSVTATAAVIGVDRRVPFSLNAARAPFALTSIESSRLRNLVGYVFCPGAQDLQNSYGATGFLVGTATDMYVVTVAHAFIDSEGGPRDPLSSCSFTSYGIRSEKIPLVFNRKNGASFAFGTLDWKVDFANDVAIIRLSRPSPEAEPFRLSQIGSASLKDLDDAHLFALSAFQRGFDVGSDLILQNCAVRQYFPSNPKRPGVAYTDCAAHVGASGSVLLTRVNGQVVPVGLIQASQPGPDGLPFDVASKNFTIGIGLDGRVLDKAKALMGDSF